MPLPCKMGPMGDLLDFPYRENLIAYYKDGKFSLATGRSYSELDTITSATVIAQSDDLFTLRFGGTGGHKGVELNCAYRSTNYYLVYAYGANKMFQGDFSPMFPLESAIVGAAVSATIGYTYTYSPTVNRQLSFSVSNRNRPYANAADPAVKFGCCFDRMLSKAEFDEVAEWIKSRKP